MSERWRRVGQVSRTLALAVDVTDAVTGGRPAGGPRVRIEEAEERPVRNPSGYHLFFDLPAEEVTVAVDGGDRYFDASATVDLDPAGGARDPGDAVELSLSPTPAYRFPPGLTRVRGTLRDASGPVSGAEVTVDGHSRTTRTTAAGEFVYYFADVTSADVVRADVDGDGEDERLYRPGGADPVFEVGPPGQAQQSVAVEVGRLTRQDLSY